MRVLLVAAGTVDKDVLNEEIRTSDCIIAVDGGMDVLARESVDYFIGDRDSLTTQISARKAIELPPKKDFTDLEAAIDLAIEIGAKEIRIIGAIGTRMDHSMVNIMMILHKDFPIVIRDAHNEIFRIHGRTYVQCNGYSYFSILSTQKEIEISISGAKYNLDHSKVFFGSSILTSNEWIEENVCITVNKPVILIKSRD